MSKQEQDERAVQTGKLSDEDLDKVAGGVYAATVTITVTGVNDAPTFTIKPRTTR